MSADDPFDHPLVAFFLSDDPEEILKVSRALPEASSGLVNKPGGLDARTLRPVPDGIYCAAIFGPVDEPQIRNERWGHIDLPAPVLHPRLVSTIASKLGWGVANTEAVFLRRAKLDEDGSVVHARLTKYGRYEFGNPAEETREARGPAFVQQQLGADADLLITKVPVVPAGWRSITGAENDAYRRVIDRANRLATRLEINAPACIVRDEELFLQQAFTRLCKVLRAELTAAIAKRKQPALDSRAAELLTAVYDDPADTDRRAVYADHLLSLGEPRGEFIALQLANAGGSRMTSKEGVLLRRHLQAWLHPLDAVLDPGVVFRRGFPARATTLKGADDAITALLGHEAWGTIEHLDTPNVELLTHPCLRSLRRFSVGFETLRTVCAKAVVMPGIQALTLRLASSRPHDHAAATSSRIFPNLSEITLVCSKYSGNDFDWLQGTPLVDGLEALVLVIHLVEEHAAPFAFLLDLFSCQPKLQRATLSVGTKQIVYAIARSEHGPGLAVDVTVNRGGLHRIVTAYPDSEIPGHVADALDLGRDRITSVTVRIPRGASRWLVALEARLRRTHASLVWIAPEPTHAGEPPPEPVEEPAQ